MFTGIIESLGKVEKVIEEGSNFHFTIRSSISKELKVDQSVAHNGVCLTVVQKDEESHTVTAILETMKRTNLSDLKVGNTVNLERAMLANARLDGHIVQGHVDGTGTCLSVTQEEGSWYFRFSYDPTPEHLLVDKGSICINGISLTVVEPNDKEFSVAIIPYTYEHTTFGALQAGMAVNFEFDIIGKYVARMVGAYR